MRFYCDCDCGWTDSLSPSKCWFCDKEVDSVFQRITKAGHVLIDETAPATVSSVCAVLEDLVGEGPNSTV